MRGLEGVEPGSSVRPDGLGGTDESARGDEGFSGGLQYRAECKIYYNYQRFILYDLS